MSNTISITTKTTSKQFKQFRPFNKASEDLPTFNVNWLPEDYREFALAVAENSYTDPSMVCIALLGSVSAAAQKLFRVPTKNGLTSTNVYLLVDAGTGMRKSTVCRSILKPHMIYPQLLVQNGTYAGIINRMSKTEKLFMTSTEGDLLGSFSSKGGKELQLYLSSFDGELFSKDTVSGGNICIASPSMSILVMAQDKPCRDFANNYILEHKGLLGRFLYASIKDRGYGPYESPEFPVDVEENYFNNIVDLLDYNPDELYVPLKFTEEARKIHGAFYNRVNHSYETERFKKLGGWYHRMTEHLSKMAGLLHIMKYGVISADYDIDEVTMETAVEVMDYFIAHAFDFLAGSDALDSVAERDAKYLLKHLKVLMGDQNFPVSKRTILQKCKGHFKTADAAEAGFSVLENRGYITISTVKSEGPGRPSEIIHLNPEVLSKASA